MAQLKDTIVSGNLRVTDTTLTDTLQVTTIKAPISSGGTTYGPGEYGQVLKSNGTTVYWGSDSNSVTGVKGNAESSYRTGNVNLTPANIGALALTGGTVSSSTFGTQITVERTGGANMAALGFKNTAGMLGYIAANEVDGDLFHYGADTNKKYTILDTNNLSTYVKASSNNGKLSVNGSDVTVYTHPTKTAQSTSNFYKITVDATGHVTTGDALSASNLPSHTHNSLYGVPSTSTVPVTTLADGQLKVFYNVSKDLTGNMPVSNNANAIIQINKHSGNYDSQLGFSSNGNIYYRSCNGTALSASVPWKRIYDTSNPPTASEVGALASSTKYAASSSVGGAANSSNVLNSNTRMDYGWDGVNYFNIDGTAGNAAKVNDTPTTAWWHIMRFNMHNSSGYYTDLAIPFGTTSLYYKRITAGSVQNGGWVKVLDSLNYTSYALPRNIKHIHTASGTEGTTGWVKIARITVTAAYADHPMTFTIAQRQTMQYRIHLVFGNTGSVATTTISQFIIARDNSWTDTNNNPRAYIIKPSDGIFDLYIRKIEGYDHIFVVDFTKADNSEGNNYSVAWTNVHAADSEITGGTEAVKKLYLSTSGGTVSGTLVLSKTQDASGTANNSPALIVGGAATSTHLELDANEIMAKTDGTSTAALYINNDGGNVYINNNLAARHTATPTSGQVVIADGTAGGVKSSGYTIAKSVPSNALFTDANVTQSETTTATYRPIVFGATNSTDTSTLAATVTAQTYVSTLLYAQPQNGILYANRIYLKSPGTKGQLNLWTSKYNVMLRNDDSNTYFLVTAQNDPTGTWTSARPLTINNSTGVCDINGNAATAGNANNANVTVTDVPSTSTSTDPWKASYGILFAQNPNTTQSNTLRKSHNLRFYHSRNGTADTVGIGELIIGNNTASGTAGNMQGRLTLYSSSSSCISMVPTATSSAVTLTLPAVTGTVPSFTATPTSGQVVVTDGTAGAVKSSGYTIATSVPSGAKFTDEKVTQTAVGSTYTNYRPIVISGANSATEGFSPSTTTDGTFITSSLYCQPSTGMLHANIFKAGKASTTDGEIKFYRSGGSGETTLKATAQSTSGTYLLPACGNGSYTLSIGMSQVGGVGNSLVMSNVSGIPTGTLSFKIVFKSNASLPIYSMVEIPNIGDGVDCGGLIQVGDYTDGQQGSLRIVMKSVVIRVTAGSTTGTKTFTATVSPTQKISGSSVSEFTRNVIIYKIYACC